MANHLFETYKHSVIPHVKHVFKTASDIAMATMCAYPSFKNSLPHWKFVMRCCAKCSCIDVTSPESDQNKSNVSSTIRFHVYHIITCCTVHGRQTLTKRDSVNCVRLPLIQ